MAIAQLEERGAGVDLMRGAGANTSRPSMGGWHLDATVDVATILFANAVVATDRTQSFQSACVDIAPHLLGMQLFDGLCCITTVIHR